MAQFCMLFDSRGRLGAELDRKLLNGDEGWLLRSTNISKKLFITVAILAVGSGIGTYTVFARADVAGPDPNLVIAFLYLNLTLMLVLGALVAYRLVRLWSRRRQGLAGAQLHTRLVMLFSVVAVIPTIVVAIFSVLLFDFGIRSWFSE